MPRALLTRFEEKELAAILFVINNPFLVPPTFGDMFNQNI